MKRHRLYRIVFRTGLIVIGLIGIVWVASLWRSLNATVTGWRVSFNSGWLFVRSDPFFGWEAWIGPTTSLWDEVLNNPVAQHAKRHRLKMTTSTLSAFPMWLFLLVALIPTFIAWRLLRRKPPPGHCRKCGYNLTGNVTGMCSECGEETQAKVPMG